MNSTNKLDTSRPAGVPAGPDDVSNGLVALTAERDQVTIYVLITEPLVCFVMDLEPPLAPVVEARLALVSVDREPFCSLQRPPDAGDVPLVEVGVSLDHRAALHNLPPLVPCPFVLATNPASSICPIRFSFRNTAPNALASWGTIPSR
jgi:hypothetical protein